MREAKHYKLEGNKIKCLLCPNFCELEDGQTGQCLGRGFFSGKMMPINYARVVSASADPIEKKPLYHVCPGRKIFSVGTWGCNLHCNFCQNSDLSQNEQPSVEMLPEQLLQRAMSIPDNIGVAFTYNEPGIWYEYICDCAPMLKKNNLLSVMVTNGYLCAEPWKKLCSIIDAMNIDLKAFNADFYQQQCGGKLEPVMQNIKTAVEAGVHVELTNLVITDLNDDETEFLKMINWISEVSDEIPLHISRYFPNYKATMPATDVAKIRRFAELAAKKLKFVYCGNLGSEENTLCPSCSKLLISREHYATRLVINGDKCECGQKIPILEKSIER